jgi:hypothetical protein
MNCKGCRKKWQVLKLHYCLSICPRGLRKKLQNAAAVYWMWTPLKYMSGALSLYERRWGPRILNLVVRLSGQLHAQLHGTEFLDRFSSVQNPSRLVAKRKSPSVMGMKDQSSNWRSLFTGRAAGNTQRQVRCQHELRDSSESGVLY